MLEELKELNIYNQINAILSNNIQDIKPNRESNRLIYPTYPETKANYPTVTLEITEPQFESQSAGDYFDTYTSPDGKTVIEYYYKRASATLNIYSFSSTDNSIIYDAYINNLPVALSGKNISYYYAKQCLNIIRDKREEFLEFLSDIKENKIEDTFEDKKFGWTTAFSADIVYDDIWCKKYVSGQLISSYTLTTNISE